MLVLSVLFQGQQADLGFMEAVFPRSVRGFQINSHVQNVADLRAAVLQGVQIVFQRLPNAGAAQIVYAVAVKSGVLPGFLADSKHPAADIVQGNKLIPERREGCPIRHAPQFHCFHFVISSHFSCLLPSADTMPGHREGSARLCLPCSPGAGRGRYIYATTAPCPRLPL